MKITYDRFTDTDVPVYCADCIAFECITTDPPNKLSVAKHVKLEEPIIGCSYVYRERYDNWSLFYVRTVEEITDIHIAKCKLLGNKRMAARVPNND